MSKNFLLYAFVKMQLLYPASDSGDAWHTTQYLNSYGGIFMRWLWSVFLIFLSPVVMVYSGTFVDDFSDGNLHGWHVQAHPPEFPIPFELKNGRLVMDARIDDPNNLKILSLELRTGNSESWDSYILTCQVKFLEVSQENVPSFSISVRRGVGHFDIMAEQVMLILPEQQHVEVSTIPPDAKWDREKGLVGTLDRKGLRLEQLLKVSRWHHIKIVAEKNNFEFFFNENLISQYEDDAAIPGTVRFQVESSMLVHLDDVVITGPEIPNIGGPQRVNLEMLLTTTWAKIKGTPER